MKKNGVFNNFSNTNGNNGINALLNMLMANNKNNGNAKNDNTKSTDTAGNIKSEPINLDFLSELNYSRYAKLIEKHDELSRKIDSLYKK